MRLRRAFFIAVLTLVQTLLGFRVIFGDLAMLEASGRQYYVVGEGEGAGSEDRVRRHVRGFRDVVELAAERLGHSRQGQTAFDGACAERAVIQEAHGRRVSAANNHTPGDV